MTPEVEDAARRSVLVAFPKMSLGPGGKIVADDGRVVCTMNLKDWTLPEAFAFASAFIAAGALLDERKHQ